MSLDIKSFGAKKKPETKRSYQRPFNSENWPIYQIIPHTDLTWAKHLLQAEKSTFREELSFQRSESTIGLLQVTVFVYDRKRFFSMNLTDPEKSGPNANN
jgi:hypothetical protein